MDSNSLYYNAMDSTVTYRVMTKFWRELYTKGHESTYNSTIDLYGPLAYIMTRGIRVDIENLRSEAKRVELEIIEKQKELDSIVGRPLNFNSPKQVQAYFYIEKGITPYTNDEGRPTSDDKAMARIARGTASRQPYREAKLIQELRGLSKMKGTYLEIEFDDDGRFRTSINPRGTKFGRISTSQTIFGTGMNMQNLPPAFKKFLVPDPGYLMFEMDKRQAEWVVVAYQHGDANMMQVIENGEDPHVHTAHLMFKIDKDIIKREAKVVGHTTDPIEIKRLREEGIPEIFNAPFVPRIFSMRQAGKKSNHALNYDETYKRFAMENEMSEKESKYIVEAYHRAYPGIRAGFELVKASLRHDRTLTNCFGRKQLFLDEWGPDLFKAAYAFIPQSTVADLINGALNSIYYSGDSNLEPVEFLAQVHDSILYQIPLHLGPDKILYAIERCEDFMNPQMEYNGRQFKIGTDIKLGTSNWEALEEVNLADKKSLREKISELCSANQRLDNNVP